MSPRYVVLIAVLLRVGWVLAVPSKPVGDFAMYLESATHLLEHRALDPEFVFMPGYVGFVAGLMALGAGVLTIKLVVAVAAGLAAGAVYGIAAALWDQRVGATAGLLYALWPAGVAVCSVTGTDLPTAVLVATAVWLLVRLGGTKPWLAAAAFGLVMGLAATVRAVAVPLAGFSVFYFLATGKAAAVGRARVWAASLGRAALATVVALAVLAPWAWRNHRRYGEWFITDSHGGLTALVGANPNTDGRYSRSLNRIFEEVTGYTLLAEPHRKADHASYLMARELVAFAPAYAAGLVMAKAERLLGEEKSLLYWPVYRAGVLRPGVVKNWFDAHRGALERVVDGFWWGLSAAFLAGVGLATARRRWDALWFLPIGLALLGIYALFFAEVRYQLPIVILMFPLAGGALVFARDACVHVWRLRKVPRGLRREAVFSLAAVLIVAALLPGLSWAGSQLRDRHRFAIQVFDVQGQSMLGKWRRAGTGDSPVRGVWNGVGLRLGARDPGGRVAAQAQLDLPPGRYWLQGRWDVAPVDGLAGDGGANQTVISLTANQTLLARTPLPALLAAARDGTALPVDGLVDHAGGPLTLLLEAQGPAAADLPEAAALWLSDLSIKRERPGTFSP